MGEARGALTFCEFRNLAWTSGQESVTRARSSASATENAKAGRRSASTRSSPTAPSDRGEGCLRVVQKGVSVFTLDYAARNEIQNGPGPSGIPAGTDLRATESVSGHCSFTLHVPELGETEVSCGWVRRACHRGVSLKEQLRPSPEVAPQAGETRRHALGIAVASAPERGRTPLDRVRTDSTPNRTERRWSAFPALSW